MGLFQYMSGCVRYSADAKKVQTICQRLFDVEYIVEADIQAFIATGEDGIQVLCQVLQENDPAIATTVMASLAHFGAVNILLSLLTTEQARTRCGAVKALASCVDARIVSALIEVLHDDDVRVRKEIVAALAGFADGRAGGKIDSNIDSKTGEGVTQALLSLLKDPNWQVRESAGTALAQLKDCDVFPQLDALMHQSQHHVRVQVVRTVSKMDARDLSLKGMNLIVAALDDAHVEVQFAAVKALASEHHHAAIAPLLLHYRQADLSLRKLIFAACERISMQRVVTFLGDGNSQIRIAVAEMLAQFGASDYLSLLCDAWQYEADREVQMWIVIAIGQLAVQCGQRSTDLSVKLLIQAAESGHENTAYHARKALEALPHPLAEQFTQTPLQQTQVAVCCPSCLEILTLDSPLIDKAWCCPHCFLAFSIRAGADGTMLISAVASKLKVSAPSSQTLPWFEVLSVDPDADVVAIKKAFRSLLKQYHPDKVAMLGVEFKLLAEEKTRLLTWALRSGLEKLL